MSVLFQYQRIEKRTEKQVDKRITPQVKEEDIIRFTEDSIITKNKTIPIDAVIWCTGFKTQLDHLQGLELDSDLSKISEGTRSNQHQGLWFMGYGEWSGYASATIVGVQKHAREAAKQISEALASRAS